MEEHRDNAEKLGCVQTPGCEDAGDRCEVQAADGDANKVEESSCNLPTTPADSPHETKAAREKLGAGDLYTPRDLEVLFRVTRRTITNWNIAGIIKPIKVGKLLYYRSEGIERLVRGE